MRRLLIIPIICLVLSCELVVEVDVPGEPSKLVVNSILTTDTTFLVYISASTHILNRTFPSTEAAVPVLTDGSGRQIVLSQGVVSEPSNPGSWHVNAGGWTYAASERPVPGMTYSIEVTAPNFSSVKAAALMPFSADIINARIDSTNVTLDDDGRSAMFPVDVTFRDKAGTGDYYYPQMVMLQEHKYYDPSQGDTVRRQHWIGIYMSRTLGGSDLIEFDEEEDVITDATFDGSEHTLRRYASLSSYESPHVKTVSVQFVLGHSGEEYHRYSRSKRLHHSTEGNPLAEPVQVYSNVEGGLGIFAGYTRSSWEFLK